LTKACVIGRIVKKNAVKGRSKSELL